MNKSPQRKQKFSVCEPSGTCFFPFLLPARSLDLMISSFSFALRLPILAAALILLGPLTPLSSQANVVRAVPDFSWIGADGKLENLSEFRDQPVVLLITTGPRNWAFRSQIGQLQKVYQRLAATGAVCVAAFTQETGLIRSNIPFVQAQDGPRVAFLTGTQEQRFTIIVIGKDGNMDAISQRVLKGQRVLDIIGNSFVVQQALRRP
jgi:hypothetical protein